MPTSFYEIPVVSLRIVRDAGIPAERGKIRSPADVATLLMSRMKDLDRETVVVVHLSTRQDLLNILAIENVCTGSVNTNHVRMTEMFKGAILSNASAIILAHNHPSGDPTPSPEDVQLTGQTRKAGELLGIELLDHIIIGSGSFISLKERGLGFK